MTNDGPGDGNTLALATRETIASVTDYGVVSFGESLDEFVSVGRPGCPNNLLFSRLHPAKGNVVADSAHEQGCLL